MMVCGMGVYNGWHVYEGACGRLVSQLLIT